MSEQHPEITKEPLFTADLGEEAGIFAPRTVDELREWIVSEASEWQWARDMRKPDSITNAFVAKQFSGEQDINHFISLLANDPNRKAELAPQISQRLQQRYQQERALFSGSAKARYILGFASRKARIAAHTAWVLTGQEPETSRNGMMGAALAANFIVGPQSPPDAFNSAWSETRRTVAEDHEKLKQAAGAARDEWTMRRDAMVTLHERQGEVFQVDQGTRKIAFESLMGEHTKKLQQIENTFKNDMALRATVDYFNASAEEHRIRGNKFAWASGIVATLAAAAVLVIGSVVFGSGDATRTQIGVAVILGFLVLWLLRLLVRILLGNLHLATDMKNRATLVQAYLALIAEGAALKDEDRARIVSLVFRPTTDGLVRDDGAPQTPGSFLQDLLTKPR